MKKTITDNKIILTREGLTDLKAEYETLVNTKRKEVSERIKQAREFGDISENAEYESAREEQAFVEGRISELEEILNNVSVTTNSNTCRDQVGLGCKVKVHIDGTEEEFQIVGAPEANPAEKKISHESPLGQALLGKKPGEKVAVETPSGKLVYTIITIK
ncbi:MAG: transcription elongation factor GreA [candidate division WWE3 bacterium]|nr:transcription elongation factor GreA [candidate division WWE3 bacterium]